MRIGGGIAGFRIRFGLVQVSRTVPHLRVEDAGRGRTIRRAGHSLHGGGELLVRIVREVVGVVWLVEILRGIVQIFILHIVRVA